MAFAMTKHIEEWLFHSRYACVAPRCVAQGRIVPFFGEDAGAQLEFL